MIPVSLNKAAGFIALQSFAGFPSLPIISAYKMAVRSSSTRSCALASIGGGGTAVGGLIGRAGSLIDGEEVTVLGTQEYWVDVVTGEVKEAVFVGACYQSTSVLGRVDNIGRR